MSMAGPPAPVPVIGYAPPPVVRRVRCDTVGGVLTLRDPDPPLFAFLRQEWLLLFCWAITLPSTVGLVYFCFEVSSTGEAVVLGFLTFCGLLNVLLTPSVLWLRWRCQDTVRIELGRLTIARRGPRGARPPRTYSLADLSRARAVADMRLYLSHFSVWLHFRGGESVAFLHCRNAAEARWVVRLIQDIAAATAEATRHPPADDVPYASAVVGRDLSAARLSPP
jgi:hypothetical protein